MSYSLAVANRGVFRSAEIAHMVVENRDGHPDVMKHLGAIEHLEARGAKYANHAFDVLSAAYEFATSPFMTPDHIVSE